MATEIGAAIECNLTRSEDDTDDLTVRLKDSTGALIDTTGFTAVLSVGTGKDATPAATFSGVPAVTPVQPNGLLVIDMATFAQAIASYKYDIRITDTNPGDTPSRVYFKGSFKVTARIN